VNTRGIGLGLSISKKIVEMYEGNIGFMSKWGSGSTFGFKFKILLGDDLQMKVVNESMANML